MKNWIKTNLSKITLALALTGATTGTIGLIMGVLTHNVGTNVKHYLTRNGEMVYGTTTIWVNTYTSKNIFQLYFSKKPKHEDDIKWDGNYPDWYFDN